MNKKHILWGIVVLYLLSACNLSVGDSTFFVEKGVSSVRFYITREKGSITMNLVTPNGTVITADSAKDNPNIEYTEDGLTTFYDISNPEEGKWKIIDNISNWSGRTQQLTYSMDTEGGLGVDYDVLIDGVNNNLRANGDIYAASESIEINLGLGGGQTLSIQT